NTLQEHGNTLHRSRKNAQPIREHESGSIGSKQAHAPKQTSLGQTKTHGVRTRRPRTARWTKLGAVGASGRPMLGILTMRSRPASAWISSKLSPLSIQAYHFQREHVRTNT